MDDRNTRLDEYTPDGRNANERMHTIRRVHVRISNKTPGNSAYDQLLPVIAECDDEHGNDWTITAEMVPPGKGVIEFRRGNFFLSAAGAFDAAPVVDRWVFEGGTSIENENAMRACMHGMALRWR
jgi:hypothetical protein